MLPDPKYYNSFILLTRLFNTCVPICKSECAHRLKMQYLTFPISFNIMWYASAVVYRKNLFLFHAIVRHFLVNDAGGGGEGGEKNDKE